MEQDVLRTSWRPQRLGKSNRRLDPASRSRRSPLDDVNRDLWPCVSEDPDLVAESFRLYPVMNGLNLSEIYAHALQAAERDADLGDDASPFLVMRVMMAGNDRLSVPASGNNHALTLGASSCGVFCTPESRTKVEIGPGHCRHVNLCFTPSGLHALLGDIPLPPMLQAFLAGQAVPIAWQHTATALQLRSTLDVTIPYGNQALSHLFLQSKALELAVEFLRLLNHESFCVDVSRSKDRRLVCDAQDLLTIAPALPPTLEEVARQVGTSPKRLNDAFRQHHGMTLFGWFNSWRMERARELVAKREQSIKEIAFDLGYRHVSNFTMAFTKHFGQPPARFQVAFHGDMGCPSLKPHFESSRPDH